MKVPAFILWSTLLFGIYFGSLTANLLRGPKKDLKIVNGTNTTGRRKERHKDPIPSATSDSSSYLNQSGHSSEHNDSKAEHSPTNLGKQKSSVIFEDGEPKSEENKSTPIVFGNLFSVRLQLSSIGVHKVEGEKPETEEGTKKKKVDPSIQDLSFSDEEVKPRDDEDTAAINEINLLRSDADPSMTKPPHDLLANSKSLERHLEHNHSSGNVTTSSVSENKNKTSEESSHDSTIFPLVPKISTGVRGHSLDFGKNYHISSPSYLDCPNPCEVRDKSAECRPDIFCMLNQEYQF